VAATNPCSNVDAAVLAAENSMSAEEGAMSTWLSVWSGKG
jgi:hypothetical protein